jgi:hypothetical protein
LDPSAESDKNLLSSALLKKQGRTPKFSISSIYKSLFSSQIQTLFTNVSTFYAIRLSITVFTLPKTPKPPFHKKLSSNPGYSECTSTQGSSSPRMRLGYQP